MISPQRLRSDRFAPALLAALAACLMLPVLLGPVRLNDSHWINLVWSEQFTRSIASGIIWPRWLPLSHGGLGSPVFFFYGPVSFWLAALFGLCGLATWTALMMAALVASWVSGLAFHRYVQGSAHPLIGAALYVALPYHVLDFKMRGALAEFVAYAALPLVALGIRRVKVGQVAPLAVSYALLVMTHLPTALLATLFLVPILLVHEHGLDRRRLVRCGGGLALGLLLSAPYLLPALSLQPYVSIATMTASSSLRGTSWTIFTHDPRIAGGLVMLGSIAAASLPIALCRLRNEWLGWAAIGLVAMALGVVPAFWGLPILAKVQFPWRLLVVVDFVIALLVAQTPWRTERLALLIAPPLIMSAIVLLAPAPATSRAWLHELTSNHPDVIEYLPPELGETTEPFSRKALALAGATLPGSVTGRTTVFRRFAFPSWAVVCQGGPVVSSAQPGTGLIQYRGTDCTVKRRVTAPEIGGWLLAAIAGLWLVLSRFRWNRPTFDFLAERVRTARSPREKMPAC